MKKNIKKPNAILFVCNINSIRSPMAEAITKEWFDRKRSFTERLKDDNKKLNKC